MENQLKIDINLSGKEESPVGNAFFKWAINGGKVLIIITELVTLAALSYRFYIDRRIVDLNDEIKRQELFVRAQAEKEAEFRNFENRLENIQTITEESQGKVDLMSQIIMEINDGNFTSTNLTVNQNSINLEGETFSIFTLNSFIESLKKQETVSSINIDEIDSTQSGIRFRISIQLVEPTIQGEES